jgi:hypothetical protein
VASEPPGFSEHPRRCPVRKFAVLLAGLVTLVFFAVLSTQSQAYASPQERDSTQRLVCHTGYTLNNCVQDLAVLRKTLAKYPVQLLGKWTWVAVRSQDWKAITKRLGLSPYSPAFTCLGTRATFIEEVLLRPEPGRSWELMGHWHMGVDRLLESSVTHEMGHALCDTGSEQKAEQARVLLEERKVLSCESERAQRSRLDEIFPVATLRIQPN